MIVFLDDVKQWYVDDQKHFIEKCSRDHLLFRKLEPRIRDSVPKYGIFDGLEKVCVVAVNPIDGHRSNMLYTAHVRAGREPIAGDLNSLSNC